MLCKYSKQGLSLFGVCAFCFRAGGLLLEHELLGPELTAQLSLLASFDSCNLKHLSLQHLVSTFLPCILPAAWLGKAVVDWAAPEGTSQAPVTW